MNRATCVIFEGVPTYPTPARCWEVVDKFQVGASTQYYIRFCIALHCIPLRCIALHALTSTESCSTESARLMGFNSC